VDEVAIITNLVLSPQSLIGWMCPITLKFRKDKLIATTQQMM